MRATIDNRGADAVRLTAAIFERRDRLRAVRPARFFKHGYQSWSASGRYDVDGSRTHPRDTANFITRVNHQSETTRPPNLPRRRPPNFSRSSKQRAAERVLAGFIGGAILFRRSPLSSSGKNSARAISTR